MQTYQTKPTKPNLPNQTYLTKPTKQKLLVKVVNAWVRSAFGNVSFFLKTDFVFILVENFVSIKNCHIISRIPILLNTHFIISILLNENFHELSRLVPREKRMMRMSTLTEQSLSIPSPPLMESNFYIILPHSE